MKMREKMAIALLVIGFLVFTVPGLEAKEIKVKCDKGESVQKELDKLDGPATIVVTGTCHEYLEIKKDDVTIQGGTYLPPTPPDPNRNIIFINSARRVSITGVIITGGRSGISVYQGGSLTLDNSTISEATSYGVLLSYGASVNINACIIQQNTLEGVMVTNNSALNLTKSTITANRRTGIVVTRSSSAQLGHSASGVPGLNTITDNLGNGLSITRSAFASIDNNTITGNSSIGLEIEGASATVTNNTIAHNQWGIIVANSGNARIGIDEVQSAGPNTIENNVYEGILIMNSAAAYMLANTIRSNGQTTGRPGVNINRANGQLIGDNKIQENGGHGVAVSLGALLQGVGGFNITAGPDVIKENGHSGIYGWNNASLDIRSAEVTNNVQNGIVLSLQSTLRIYGATVSDNGKTTPGVIGHGIVLWDGSSVARYSTDYPRDTITGNSGWGIICHGESTLVGGTGASGVSGNTAGNVNCP